MLLGVFSFASGCEKQPRPRAVEDIVRSGEIRFVMRNGGHSYYIYRDQPMGFEYDLAKAFAKELGVRLKVVVAEERHQMIRALLAGSADCMAAGLPIDSLRKKGVMFSEGYMETQPHIISHRQNLKIRRAQDLAGETLHLGGDVSWQESLRVLRDMGIDVKVAQSSSASAEALIREVALQRIGVTLAGSHIALLTRRYHPQVCVADPIGETQSLAWAVNAHSEQLLKRVNFFFRKIKRDGKYREIYNRYYENVDTFDFVDLRTYHKRIRTKLPRYRPFIKDAAQRHGFDWRLIAAQIYQESHFNAKAKSHAGAFGLMQLTEATAVSLGVKNVLNPVDNIYAGVQHLKNLFDLYGGSKTREALFIALAAYNIGQGHIQDARRLAEEMNLDPNKWSSLKKTLPLLSRKKYYRNAAYGYCRGVEPIRYVRQIMLYYDILKRQSLEENITLAAEEELKDET
jgi:membrane-bound lytic murein transglycosylase F